jgi:polyphosphate glucokinase
MTILAIDIGGSKLKAALLDDAGRQVSERERVETPQPAPPSAVLPLIESLARKLPGFEKISVGFPGSVRDGVVRTAPNLSTPDWAGFDLAKRLQERLGKPARVLNDASVQGFGAISGTGLECMITLGTGMGFSLFENGRLGPHFELGQHIAHKDMTYDQYVGSAALKRVGLEKWQKHVRRAIGQIYTLVEYDTLLIGGGNAKRLSGPLERNIRIVDNAAGISGGAKLWAGG